MHIPPKVILRRREKTNPCFVCGKEQVFPKVALLPPPPPPPPSSFSLTCVELLEVVLGNDDIAVGEDFGPQLLPVFSALHHHHIFIETLIQNTSESAIEIHNNSLELLILMLIVFVRRKLAWLSIQRCGSTLVSRLCLGLAWLGLAWLLAGLALVELLAVELRRNHQ